MFHDYPFMISALTIILLLTAVASATSPPNYNESLLLPQNMPYLRRDTNSSVLNNTTSNTTSGSESFLWIIQDTYDQSNFFDSFSFFTGDDPTHGTVNYVDKATAFAHNLSYISWDGKVMMKGDDTNTLQTGQYRESVRVSSNTLYNTGLFILDINRAPWGCGVWPAFWTLGNGQWPATGEIDIIEGVHDNEHNQVTWHTSAASNFTGTIVRQNNQPYLNCEGSGTLPGCGVIEWSQASYGPTFDAQGGGIFAMKWDRDGISVWNFYRVAIPKDILAGTPNPATWPNPTATLEPAGCDPLKYFVNHSIVFDITFCGDWAGNSYATSGCPGTCADRLVDPTNFVNASWSINWLKVYRRQNVVGVVSASAPPLAMRLPLLLAIATMTAFGLNVL
ncbi:concanavalin A-like lectin/glucanase domain-containing protein [Multifurca ochricompacta]|uniref:Concanavalin A-like lectin/glucanase domain-containing protein n=1 Tax=Multifurca ochricompacta TaxID=376703 RepID=A0AAD4QTW2_9AGAM|nr:concanavalin A-like lectin/glucanase domain-containing protein [Multifurca ochricompacta]